MSSTIELRLEEPARPSAILAVAGAQVHMRRLAMLQGRTFPTTAIYRGDQVLAVAFFRVHSCKRLEFALAIHSAAKPHMRGLIRLAHLTLARLAETYLVFANVHPRNSAGRRMARLTGFDPSKAGPQFWIFGRDR